MVNHLHDFLAHAGGHTVVHTGNGIQGNHGHAIDNGRDDTIDIFMPCRKDNTQRQRRHGKGTPDDMGGGIQNFFPAGVVRENAVT